MGQGSSVTYRVQLSSRQSPRAWQAISMARTSACPSGEWVTSRSLRAAASTVLPHTTTAPTGISPAAAAFFASIRARRIYLSWSILWLPSTGLLGREHMGLCGVLPSSPYESKQQGTVRSPTAITAPTPAVPIPPAWGSRVPEPIGASCADGAAQCRLKSAARPAAERL